MGVGSTGDGDAEREDPSPREVADSLRSLREDARRSEGPPGREGPPAGADPAALVPPLSPLPDPRSTATEPGPTSPSRDELNAGWDLREPGEASPGILGRLFSPLRRPLRRIVRFALGASVDRQIGFNSAQVRFDNEIVRYLDERVDRISRHYDSVLGAHGRRMEEIDERHLILQQELIRHVHDLVERIEFVFETAEQNHLYLDGVLRETRDEVRALRARVEELARPEEPPER